MLRVKVELNDNRGSFAIDAIATTIGGTWLEGSATDSGGIITDVPLDNREWVEEVLEDDDNVISYSISE